MSPAIVLDPEHRAIVLDILRRHAPPGARVLVFGSRAGGRARLLSDLDLALDAGRMLTIAECGALAEAFEESDLPWTVDVVDLCAVSPAFRQAIEPAAMHLTPAD